MLWSYFDQERVVLEENLKKKKTKEICKPILIEAKTNYYYYLLAFFCHLVT